MIYMKKNRWLTGLFAAVLCANASAASLLLVLNKGDRTLAIVDGETLQVKGHVPSGPDPHEVIASADGRMAWISNYTQGNTLTPVDLVAPRALPAIDMSAFSRPHGLTLAGGKVY